MKLEVGMYVKTNDGSIYKVFKNIEKEENIVVKGNFLLSEKLKIGYEELSKASYNIIDLIQENDFVNGHRVIQVDRESLELDIENSMYGCGCETINGDRDIKSIVTKEMFESMSYKVGE